MILGKSRDCHRLEERGKIDSAMACYREALDFDPGEETAKARRQALTVAIETKVCWPRAEGVVALVDVFLLLSLPSSPGHSLSFELPLFLGLL